MSVKYLIGDKNGKIYTIENDSLKELTGYLGAELFQSAGVDDIPASALLVALENPTVYCWKDVGELPKLTATVTGLPWPQVIYSRNIDMSDATIIGVESVSIDGDDNTLFAVSFDGGDTWWNYVNLTWVQLTEEASGQTREDIEAISTSAWAKKATTGTIRFRFVLSTAANRVSEIRINYLNTETGASTEKTLTGLTVKTPPTKQIYNVGEALDLTGVLVLAEYDTGAKAAVSNGCHYAPADGETLITVGTQTVEVSYTESGVSKSAAFTITVL